MIKCEVQKIETALSCVAFALFLAFVVTLTSVALVISLPHILFRTMRPIPLDQEAAENYDRIFQSLADGDLQALEAEAARDSSFPASTDPFVHRPWVTNAIEAGNIASLKWVLDRGVPLNFHDDEGRSPLDAAIQEDRPDLVALLIKRGADVNLGGTLNETPLHTAAALGRTEIARLLLDHGADPMAWDVEYLPRRPIDYARRANHDETHALLAAAMHQSETGS